MIDRTAEALAEIERGVALLEIDRVEASRAADAARALAPDLPDAHWLEARALQQRGGEAARGDEASVRARELFAAARRRVGASPRDVLREAELEFHAFDLRLDDLAAAERGRARATEAIDHPRASPALRAEALIIRALCQHALGAGSAAAADLRAAVDLESVAALDLLTDPSAIGALVDPAAEVARAVGRHPDALAIRRFEVTFRWRDQGDPARALELVDALLERAPEDLATRVEKAQVLFELGRVADARAALDEAEDLPGGDRAGRARLHVLRARILFPSDQAAAVAQFDRAIEHHPDLYEAHLNRAIALHRLGRFGEAVDGFRAAVALRLVPEKRALVPLALAYIDLERFDEAMAALSQALELDPDPQVRELRAAAERMRDLRRNEREGR